MIDTNAPRIRWRTLLALGLAWAAAGLGRAAEPGADARPLAGRTLRVAIAPIVTAVEFAGDKPYGAMIDIWDDLAGRLGVATEFVRQPTFQDLMAIVAKGDVDLALGPLAITEDRERTIDFTHPVFHSGLRLAVRQKTDTGFLAAIRSLLSWQLLELAGLVLALALLSGHLLWWAERRHNPHSFPRAYPRGMFEALWWIASTIVTGGCDDKHVDGPAGRLIAFAWMVGGIGLIAAFTSVLTATLTAEQVTGVIHGPRDVAGRTVGCLTASVAITSVAQRGAVVREYATAREAIEALSLGMVEAVAGENESLMFLIKQFGGDRLKVVGPIFESLDFGIALPNGSPLREPLNTTILRMREDGVLDRIREKWLGKHD